MTNFQNDGGWCSKNEPPFPPRHDEYPEVKGQKISNDEYQEVKGQKISDDEYRFVRLCV